MHVLYNSPDKFCSDPDWVGSNRVRLDWIRLGRVGLGPIFGQVGSGWVGLDPIFGQVGSDWVGLDPIGLRIRFSRVGSDWVESDPIRSGWIRLG